MFLHGTCACGRLESVGEGVDVLPEHLGGSGVRLRQQVRSGSRPEDRDPCKDGR